MGFSLIFYYLWFLYTSVLNWSVIYTINVNYTLLYINVITSLKNLHDLHQQSDSQFVEQLFSAQPCVVKKKRNKDCGESAWVCSRSYSKTTATCADTSGLYANTYTTSMNIWVKTSSVETEMMLLLTLVNQVNFVPHHAHIGPLKSLEFPPQKPA